MFLCVDIAAKGFPPRGQYSCIAFYCVVSLILCQLSSRTFPRLHSFFCSSLSACFLFPYVILTSHPLTHSLTHTLSFSLFLSLFLLHPLPLSLPHLPPTPNAVNDTSFMYNIAWYSTNDGFWQCHTLLKIVFIQFPHLFGLGCMLFIVFSGKVLLQCRMETLCQVAYPYCFVKRMILFCFSFFAFCFFLLFIYLFENPALVLLDVLCTHNERKKRRKRRTMNNS